MNHLSLFSKQRTKAKALQFLLCSLILLFTQQRLMAQAPTSLRYPAAVSYEVNVSNVFLSPTVSGLVTSYSISPTTLPAGLTFTPATGVITGVPTAPSPNTTFTVTATNSSGSTSTSFTMQALNYFYDNNNGKVSFLSANSEVKVNNGGAGKGGQNVNDLVLYKNVVTIGMQQIDCIIKTTEVTNVTSWSAYDQNAASGSGYSSNNAAFFSPQLNFGAGGGSVVFNFQYILGGSYDPTTQTGTNVTLQNVKLNTYDIDGNGGAGTKQFNSFDGFSAAELGTTTNLIPSFNIASGRTRFTSNTDANITDATDPKTRVRVNYNNISNFNIRVGAEGSGAAFYFLDFSSGPAFTTNTTQAPSLDLNTARNGTINGFSSCGSTIAFTAASQTNIIAPGALDALSIKFSASDILNGADEVISFDGIPTTIPLNYTAASSSNVAIGGVTYSAARSVTGTGADAIRSLVFTKSGGGTLTVAQAEALLDAMRYQNNAPAPTAGTRDFTINVRNNLYQSPDALFTANITCVQLSGHIYRDANALADNTVNGSAAIPFPAGSMYAVLTNESDNKVAIAPQPIDAAGFYTFGNAAYGKYNIYVVPAGSVPAVGATFTTAILPTPAAGTGAFIFTGENLTENPGSDLLPDGKLMITLGTISVNNANFGLEQIPTNANSAYTAANPLGYNFYTIPNGGFVVADADGTVDSIVITSFPTNANYLKIGSTVYTNPAGGICPPQSTCTPWPGSVRVQFSGGNPVVPVSVDPASNGNSTVVIPFYAVDNGYKRSAANSNVTINFTVPATPLSISGNVWNDADGNGLKGTGENYINTAAPGQTLYAVLVQTNNTYSGQNTIFAASAVSAVATGYTLTGVPANSDFEVRLYSLASAPQAGAALTTIAPNLATGWIGVSTNKNGVIATGQNTNNPINSLPAFSSTATNVNFGIEQIPTSGGGSNNLGDNPGGTTQINVPAETFSNTTPSTDPNPGEVKSIRIVSFPTNTTTIVINGSSYNSSTFPVNGVLIPASSNGQPTQPITVDPSINGSGAVLISFKAVDAAGRESSNTGTASLQFTINIGGNVFHDANGLNGLPLNVVDGTGTNAGGLNAFLINNSGNVVATAALGSTGTYNFPGLQNGDYSVRITTATATVGQPAPAVALPAGWVNVGENNCGTLTGCAGNDGTPDGILSLGTVNKRITQANFGIEQTPTADNHTQTLAGTFITGPQPNDEFILNSSTGGLMALSGMDPEDGALTAATTNRTVRIVTLPTNGTLLYNGIPALTGQTIPSFQPNLLVLKLTGTGYTETQFTYSYLDAAGIAAPAANYAVNWSVPLPVTLSGFTAQVQGKDAVLEWETASEENTKGFHIERSNNGRDWQTTGFVFSQSEGKLSQASHSYQYRDLQPGNGIFYYRLSIEDLDNSSSYSPVRQLKFNTEGAAISLYPNPAKQQLTVTGSNIEKLVLRDLQGRIMHVSVVQQTTDKWELQTGTLPAGVYMLTLQVNGQSESYRIVVAR